MVANQDALTQAAARFSGCPVIAVDLEADSMYHFREKVCLLQMAAAGESVVIDPLAVSDLSAVAPLFASADIRKIFHGADYDVRSLYRDFGIVIDNLFDTQIAATFLGFTETGLDSMLRQCFGIRLDKKFQKKDWSRRPLPEEMVSYAARDVIYLEPLAERLRAELEAKGRLSWVEEECDLLRQVRPPEPDGSPLFLRFKGAGRLDRRSLAVLEALLQLRSAIAARWDRPLFKVLGNAALLTLAKEKPTTPQALSACKALSAKQIAIHGEAVLAAVDRALSLPPNRLPRYPRQRPQPMAPEVPDRIAALRAWRDRKARKLGLDPAVLFNKAQLTAIARACPRRLEQLRQIPEIRRWQFNSFGRNLIAVLSKVK
ncbi:MAG: ribonuclease D [Deltaproteobacteria bacterium]|nr:ribonuclease D [Deltaproteobacteria bacterium]RLB96688.1 MAG: ribonuclease D [Deltaproteobacteria bacterium]